MKLALKVTPGAKKNEVLGWEDDYPQIGRVLKIRIAAPPVEGKANKEIVLFLSKLLKVTKSSIEVVHGTSGRIKLVEIPDGTDLSLLN
jgi:uncharacterized protein (TIGR00251 family)